MKKRNKIILIVMASIVLLGIIFGTVDYIRAKNGKLPIFAIYVHKEGDWDRYYGLGYMVINMEDCQDNPVKFGLYFTPYACFIGPDYITSVEVVETEKCDNKAKLYYIQENKNIYTYCLDQIKVSEGNETMQLKDYLKTDSNAINFIIDNFTREPEGSYDDGGTMLYYGTDFNVLKCHTLAGNEDIYIGNKNMGYLNSFCE